MEHLEEVGFRVVMDDRVAVAVIDRPHRMNSLSRDPAEAIVSAFDTFHRDPGIWAAVLRGSGHRAFCAGGDLKEMHEAELSARFREQPMYVHPHVAPNPYLSEYRRDGGAAFPEKRDHVGGAADPTVRP
jgi:enoyl-CoA hydratase/carnithine racemase